MLITIAGITTRSSPIAGRLKIETIIHRMQPQIDNKNPILFFFPTSQSPNNSNKAAKTLNEISPMFIPSQEIAITLF